MTTQEPVVILVRNGAEMEAPFSSLEESKLELRARRPGRLRRLLAAVGRFIRA